MAKRFTDTEKWKKPFIRGLNAPYKLLWLYICDDCDYAGIWQVDIEVAALRIGECVTEQTALSFFGEKIILIDNGTKWFIPSFIEFQYPSGLNQTNKAHGGIINILKKYNLINDEFKPLTSPLQGAKDKDKEMDKVKVMEMDKEMNKDKKILKSKKNLHLFRDSVYYEIKNFQIALLGTQYELANAKYYYEALLNWSDSKGEKKLDWLATAKGWMARDMKDGKFIDLNYKPNGQTNRSSEPRAGEPGFREAVQQEFNKRYGSGG